MRQVVEEQAKGDAHHQRRREPAVEDEIDEAVFDAGQHDREEDAARQAPLEQLMAAPELALKEEILVIEEARRDQPQRPEGADDVIGIVLRIVHMGVVLQVHSREHREAEPQQQGRAVAHHGVPEAAGVGGVVAGVMDDRALQVQGQEAGGQQQRQRPVPAEPAGDRDQGQGVATQEQTNGGIPGGRRVEELLRHRAHRSAQLLPVGADSQRLNQSLRHPLDSAVEQCCPP